MKVKTHSALCTACRFAITQVARPASCYMQVQRCAFDLSGEGPVWSCSSEFALLVKPSSKMSQSASTKHYSDAAGPARRGSVENQGSASDLSSEINTPPSTTIGKGYEVQESDFDLRSIVDEVKTRSETLIQQSHESNASSLAALTGSIARLEHSVNNLVRKIEELVSAAHAARSQHSASANAPGMSDYGEELLEPYKQTIRDLYLGVCSAAAAGILGIWAGSMLQSSTCSYR